MKKFEELKVVAVVFIILGMVAVGNALVALLAGEVRLGLDLLMLPAGIGLLRFKDAWRVTALIIIVLYILGLIAVPVVAYAVAPVFTVTIAGNTIEPTSPQAVALIITYTVVVGTMLVWALRLLTRPDVVSRFAETADSRE